MDTKKLAKAAAPNKLAVFVSGLPQHQMHDMHDEHGGHGMTETVREDEHDGHKIVVRTTYRIEVDGKPLQAPIGVDNDGNLHCHSIPNYQFDSAIDMVKSLIDAFPDEFESTRSAKSRSAKKRGGHSSRAKRKPAKKGGR